MGKLSGLPKSGIELGVWEGFRIVGVGSGDWGLFTGAKRWLPPDPPPPPLAGTHTLQLTRVQLLDSGMYICEALNAAGRDHKLVQLSVLGTCHLSPHLHCPRLLLHPHTPSPAQSGEGQPAPGEPGTHRAVCCSGVWGTVGLRSWLLDSDALGFEIQLCASLLCDLGQVTLPL